MCKCGQRGGHSPPQAVFLTLVSWPCQQQECLGHTRARSTVWLGTWRLGHTLDLAVSESYFQTLIQSTNTGFTAVRVLGKQTRGRVECVQGVYYGVSVGPVPVQGVERSSVARRGGCDAGL